MTWQSGARAREQGADVAISLDHLVRPPAQGDPDGEVERLGGLVVAADAAGGAAGQQQRARNLAAGLEVGLVHGQVDLHASAIVLADGVDGFGMAEAALVFGERLFTEEAQALPSLRELLLDEPV